MSLSVYSLVESKKKEDMKFQQNVRFWNSSIFVQQKFKKSQMQTRGSIKQWFWENSPSETNNGKRGAMEKTFIRGTIQGSPPEAVLYQTNTGGAGNPLRVEPSRKQTGGIFRLSLSLTMLASCPASLHAMPCHAELPFQQVSYTANPSHPVIRM